MVAAKLLACRSIRISFGCFSRVLASGRRVLASAAAGGKLEPAGGRVWLPVGRPAFFTSVDCWGFVGVVFAVDLAAASVQVPDISGGGRGGDGRICEIGSEPSGCTRLLRGRALPRCLVVAPGSSLVLEVSFIAVLDDEPTSVGWALAHAAADRVRIACAWCSGSSVSGIALPLPFFVVVFLSSVFVVVLDSSEAGCSDFLLTLPCTDLIGVRGFKGNSYKPV